MLKIAFYNIRYIIGKSKEAKKDSDNVKKMLKEPFEKKEAIETNIERIKQTLHQNFSKMPEEEKADHLNLIQSELEELKKVDDFLDKTLQEKEGNMVNRIIDIAKEISKKQKISFLFEEIQSFLTYAEKKYDISDLIIEKLDAAKTKKTKE